MLALVESNASVFTVPGVLCVTLAAGHQTSECPFSTPVIVAEVQPSLHSVTRTALPASLEGFPIRPGSWGATGRGADLVDARSIGDQTFENSDRKAVFPFRHGPCLVCLSAPNPICLDRGG